MGRAIIKSSGREVPIEIYPHGFYVVRGRSWHGPYGMNDPRFEIVPPDHVLMQNYCEANGAEFPLENYGI